MFPGETMLSGAKPEPCEFCGGTEYPLQVLVTCAPYVGTACAGCGCPSTRETDYFGSREEAETVLADILAGQMENTRAFQAGMLPGVSHGGDA